MAGVTERDVELHAERLQRVADQKAAHGMGEGVQVLNTPSKLWRLPKMQKKVEKPKDPMPWTCCHLRTAVRLRDRDILDVIKSKLFDGAHGKFGIYKAIIEDHDECASAIMGYFPTMMKERSFHFLRKYQGITKGAKSKINSKKDNMGRGATSVRCRSIQSATYLRDFITT